MSKDIHTNFQVDEGETMKTPRIETRVEDDTDDEATPPPLWKQAAGAVVGALIALAVYSVYEAAAPTVTAWLTDDTTQQDVTAVKTSERHQRGQVQE